MWSTIGFVSAARNGDGGSGTREEFESGAEGTVNEYVYGGLQWRKSEKCSRCSWFGLSTSLFSRFIFFSLKNFIIVRNLLAIINKNN